MAYPPSIKWYMGFRLEPAKELESEIACWPKEDSNGYLLAERRPRHPSLPLRKTVEYVHKTSDERETHGTLVAVNMEQRMDFN